MLILAIIVVIIIHNNSLFLLSIYLPSSPEAVIVLQTNSTHVPVPYFIDHNRNPNNNNNIKSIVLLASNPRVSSAKSIISGISKALGGLGNSLIEGYSPQTQQITTDYTWVAG